MNTIVKTVLNRRGITDVDAYLKTIEHIDNDLLLNIDVLCERLKSIHDRQLRIVVIPDFDMDGIMSGVIGFTGLTELGFNTALYVPNPSNGYGFSIADIDEIMKQPDTKAIITCDVGTSCIKGVAYAKSLGIDVFVTDHHILPETGAAQADVIVNPMLPADTCRFKDICGAFVLYKCLYRYSQLYGNVHQQDQIRRLKVFAGIGTVSDVMPVLYENRQLIKESLALSRLIYSNGNPWFVDAITGCDIYKNVFKGLYNVYNTLKETSKLSSNDDIDEVFYGFYIAPLFNSVKRIGVNGDMEKAFNIFIGSQDESCDNIKYLIELNEKRKTLVSEKFAELTDKNNYQPYAPYIYILTDAPAGVLGLLATKFAEKNQMPAFVFHKSDNGYSGSGRTPSWYPAIDICMPQGFNINGHQNAFGISVSSNDELKRLFEFVSTSIEQYKPVGSSALTPCDFIITVNGENADSGIDIPLFAEYLHEIPNYKPFGKDFPLPQFCFRFKASDGEWMRFRSHLKIKFIHGFEVICWNGADSFTDYIDNGVSDVNTEYEIIGTMNLNSYMGNNNISLIGDIRAISET